MSGYVFLANSVKPAEEQKESREAFEPSNFSLPALKVALDMEYDVYMGIGRANAEELECTLPIKLYDAHTYRSITAFKDNFIAYKNLHDVIKKANVEVIHCNTPVGGMIGRICGKLCGVKKVIYTAHGFHFYKGAPLFNRTILKWAEKVMAHWTDAIITMNKEDFEAAKKFKLRNDGKVYFVHGVGVNTEDFIGIDSFRENKRRELALADDDIMLMSMGDLVPRKNYGIAIEAIAKASNPKLKYFICGKGPELENLEKLAKELGVESQIIFMGFRSDIKELLSAADIFLFTTKQEGLPRSMMEAMAAGVPCIASKIRGNVDLIEDGIGGYLCETNDSDAYAEKINLLANDSELRKKMSESNLKTIKPFDVKNVEREIKSIYAEVLK